VKFSFGDLFAWIIEKLGIATPFVSIFLTIAAFRVTIRNMLYGKSYWCDEMPKALCDKDGYEPTSSDGKKIEGIARIVVEEIDKKKSGYDRLKNKIPAYLLALFFSKELVKINGVAWPDWLKHDDASSKIFIEPGRFPSDDKEYFIKLIADRCLFAGLILQAFCVNRSCLPTSQPTQTDQPLIDFSKVSSGSFDLELGLISSSGLRNVRDFKADLEDRGINSVSLIAAASTTTHDVVPLSNTSFDDEHWRTILGASNAAFRKQNPDPKPGQSTTRNFAVSSSSEDDECLRSQPEPPGEDSDLLQPLLVLEEDDKYSSSESESEFESSGEASDLSQAPLGLKKDDEDSSSLSQTIPGFFAELDERRKLKKIMESHPTRVSMPML
jgi:hypothetical protein